MLKISPDIFRTIDVFVYFDILIQVTILISGFNMSHLPYFILYVDSIIDLKISLFIILV